MQFFVGTPGAYPTLKCRLDLGITSKSGNFERFASRNDNSRSHRARSAMWQRSSCGKTVVTGAQYDRVGKTTRLTVGRQSGKK